ncbi:MAG TPA: glycine zipper family protein [Polyangiaceae bacterium]|nr:glycine zipper family protein [Polyangiaceae bacterium]
MSAPVASRLGVFGDLASIDLTLARPIDSLVRALPFPRELKLPSSFLSGLSDIPNPFIPSDPALNHLEFRLHSVKCVDETDGFLGSEAGSDEISIGGVTTDDTGDVEKVIVTNIGSFSKDGVVKNFSPPRSFATFDLTEAPFFPAFYSVTLVLAEVDMGGLPEFVNGLYNKVKEKVITALTTAIGTAIGATTGPVGAVIGAVVGFIVGEVFQVLKSTWDDDVFRPATLQIEIPSRSHRFENGAQDSPEGTTTFNGHGGKYQVAWDWRLFA